MLTLLTSRKFWNLAIELLSIARDYYLGDILLLTAEARVRAALEKALTA